MHFLAKLLDSIWWNFCIFITENSFQRYMHFKQSLLGASFTCLSSKVKVNHTQRFPTAEVITSNSGKIAACNKRSLG
jgi:hypothetical protein